MHHAIPAVSVDVIFRLLREIHCFAAPGTITNRRCLFVATMVHPWRMLQGGKVLHLRRFDESLSYKLAHDKNLFGRQPIDVRSKVVDISCRAVFEKRDDMLLHVVNVSVTPINTDK